MYSIIPMTNCIIGASQSFRLAQNTFPLQFIKAEFGAELCRCRGKAVAPGERSGKQKGACLVADHLAIPIHRTGQVANCLSQGLQIAVGCHSS